MRNSTWPAWWELGRRPGQEAIRGCETKQLSFASTNSNWACLLVFATPIGWSCAFMADVCACFLAEFSGLMRKLFRTGRLFSLCVGGSGVSRRDVTRCLLQLGACTRRKL
jgi:hypothetical protein